MPTLRGPSTERRAFSRRGSAAGRSLAAPLLCAALFATLVVPAASAEEPAAKAPWTGTLARDLDDLRVLLKKARYDRERRAYVAPVRGGREAELTLDAELQEPMRKLVSGFRAPYLALVALEPATGRILAVAEHGTGKYEVGHALDAAYPAASVFKVVTGAALLEAGIPPDEEVCYHGGKRRLEKSNLRDDPRRDTDCAALDVAMGRSLNVVFAKLAARALTVESLHAMAGRFLFNQPLPVYPPPREIARALVSPARIPDDELAFSRTAAGFGDVYLSPLHGALLAAAVGNRGLAAEPHLVSSVGRDGRWEQPERAPSRRLVSPETAEALTRMLELTVTEGTARAAFLERNRRVLGDVRVAGKTGSLADHNPFRDYSWFVGFAPADEPEIAVAALVVNGERWVVKAPYLAREAMRTFLRGKRRASL